MLAKCKAIILHGNTTFSTPQCPPLLHVLNVKELSPTKFLHCEFEEDSFLGIITPHPCPNVQEPLTFHSTPPPP